MDLRFTPEEDAFRKEVRAYLDDLLHGEFAVIRGRGGPGDEHAFFDERLAWERRLGADGWTCVGWPEQFGGRGLPLNQQVIYFEEYARAGGPGPAGPHRRGAHRADHHRTSARPSSSSGSCPAIRLGQELWCQGYSEPDAGSDLANIATRAALATDSDGRRVGASTARRCGPRWPTGATGASCWPAPTATPPSTRASPSCSSAWTRRASRSAPSCSSPAPPSSTRCSSPAPARRPTWWWAA